MTPNQIRKMLKQAMKDRARTPCEQMKEGRTLDLYLDRLTGSVLETRSNLEDQATDAVRNHFSPDYQEGYREATQELNNRFKAAEETAVAQAIEAMDALQKSSETYESTEQSPPGPTASNKAKLPIRRELILENLERNKNNPPKRRKPTPSNVVPFRKASKS